MNPLSGKRILIGLTGGIACYKTAELVRRLQDHGAIITVAMTHAATQFVTPTTFQALSGNPVYTETLDDRMENSMAHINLSRQSDLILIVPASADFMAKLAHGLADDLLSTLCLARGLCPLVVVPAMNREMWAHPATRRNAAQLQDDGVTLWGPGSGSQACGEVGDGRMLEPEQIVFETQAFFQDKSLAGRQILVTAGPTQEDIDPVRYISNRSSGKMGYAIARAAWEAGARVTLVSGPTALEAPYGVERINVKSGRQMHAHVMQLVPGQDIFISVAAVADWHVSNTHPQKVKKTGAQGGLDLALSENPDILAEVAALPNGPWCVGFAAETENLHDYAEAKRKRKNIPLLVGNLAQETMESDQSRMVLFDEQGNHPLPLLDKPAAARRLIVEIANRINHLTSSGKTP
ncbi:phosphopantothenate synthase [Advenella kashmirensis W13003]|uniref:Coenzyme A biosynthesis bifunctional protein CoaBC n=1 Tax=Advenella kashmirensis W13003 TaxID=1424334 RepID=V8QLR6_9BURK|nr:bifunctional phosphopantothenoylcysteine decarboxylase/phosphopantothenate--cysteine ligase CoaBC [Advenella kashmirensis]ETF00263.1 phosphopantothenate synthase [Advenella kashmirensis W13003]